MLPRFSQHSTMIFVRLDASGMLSRWLHTWEKTTNKINNSSDGNDAICFSCSLYFCCASEGKKKCCDVARCSVSSVDVKRFYGTLAQVVRYVCWNSANTRRKFNAWGRAVTPRKNLRRNGERMESHVNWTNETWKNATIIGSTCECT